MEGFGLRPLAVVFLISCEDLEGFGLRPLAVVLAGLPPLFMDSVRSGSDFRFSDVVRTGVRAPNTCADWGLGGTKISMLESLSSSLSSSLLLMSITTLVRFPVLPLFSPSE